MEMWKVASDVVSGVRPQSVPTGTLGAILSYCSNWNTEIKDARSVPTGTFALVFQLELRYLFANRTDISNYIGIAFHFLSRG
jgi:hypothetical protein